MGRTQIVIVGATAPEIIKLLEAINKAGVDEYEVLGFVDDDQNKHGQFLFNYPVLGGTALLANKLRGCAAINNVAKTSEVRSNVLRKLRNIGVTNLPPIVHPSVDLRHTSIGPATVIHEGCVLGPGVSIGENCLLSFRATIAHESSVGNGVIISPGVIVNGRVRIQDGAFLGAGAVILPYCTVGAWSVVGAGSTAIRDVPHHSTVFGVPGRVVQVRDDAEKKSSMTPLNRQREELNEASQKILQRI